MALSSDGTRLVYSANQQIYLRALDQTEAVPVRGTEGGARNPFFSPDGEWVGFWVDGELRKVLIEGGAPVRLCEALRPLGASWGADDAILFGQHGVGILRVSAAGGTPEVLVPLDLPVRGHGPQILPGDKAVLLTLGDGPNWNDAQIVVHSLETGERKVLIEDGRDARHLPTGHLVYVLDGTLLAVPFDAERLEVTGGPVPMVEEIDSASPSGASQFSVSDTGSLVYVSGQTTKRTLVWVDREGREEVLKVEPRAFSHPRISPDGSRIALALRDQEEDIWIWDLARETLTRLTFAPGRDSYPVWTLDGQRLVFSSDRDGSQNLYWKATDGTGSVERLTKSESDHFAYAFTPAGGQLVFLELGEQGADLGVLTLEGSSEPLLATEFDERTAALSPNGIN